MDILIELVVTFIWSVFISVYVLFILRNAFLKTLAIEKTDDTEFSTCFFWRSCWIGIVTSAELIFGVFAIVEGFKLLSGE